MPGNIKWSKKKHRDAVYFWWLLFWASVFLTATLCAYVRFTLFGEASEAKYVGPAIGSAVTLVIGAIIRTRT